MGPIFILRPLRPIPQIHETERQFLGGETTIRTWQLVTVVEPSSLKKICEPSIFGAILRRGIGVKTLKNSGNHHLAGLFLERGEDCVGCSKKSFNWVPDYLSGWKIVLQSNLIGMKSWLVFYVPGILVSWANWMILKIISQGWYNIYI